MLAPAGSVSSRSLEFRVQRTKSAVDFCPGEEKMETDQRGEKITFQVL
jgi:hypothetical protein